MTREAVQFSRMMIYVSDLKRSVAFYTMLGLTVTTQDHEVARLADGGVTTLVLHAREHDWEVVSRGCRLYFAAADAAETVERLMAAHPEATVLDPVRRRPWGRRHGYILDPDGWEISIFDEDPG
jgi:predicted enzyme related to lactoylglutathione lyase